MDDTHFHSSSGHGRQNMSFPVAFCSELQITLILFLQLPLIFLQNENQTLKITGNSEQGRDTLYSVYNTDGVCQQ